jgi:hypothetical protein
MHKLRFSKITGDNHTNSLSLANFVGRVVGFLNVLVIRWMPARRMPGSLLLAAALSFESELVSYSPAKGMCGSLPHS